MNLQNGKLYWPDTFQSPASYPSLEEDMTVDVLIIGGGGSGAQCAYLLSKQGLSVAVADKRSFGEGSTSSNTSLIQYAGDKTFTQLIHTFGEKNASKHLKLCETAISDIEAICADLPIQADFTRRNSLYYASYKDDVKKLKEEYSYLIKHGFSVEWWDEDLIASRYPFSKKAALYYLNDAEMNPLKFVHGLFEAAKPAAKYFEQTKINGMKRKGQKNHFYTDKGRTIAAKYAIICGGYETLEMKKEKNAVMESTYTIVTNVMEDFEGWHERSLIWESARPYIYLRTTPDNRIIAGGLDEATNIPEERDAKLLNKRDLLIQELNKLFPDYDVKADYYLSALYGGTHDGLPVVGMYENWPDCFFLMGYGDNGTVYSMVLSKLICEQIVTGKSQDLGLYTQTRPFA
ncbi:NAD(P)/FAD-dependent oxidoreductase [Metabacillus sp. 113a]|uniref:NAD(P)/FAD-dependent oxidoreductase n=1 Tax=Metabacillus sp. 113a TaxID=3404706 RepID=UPI003CF8CF03